MMTRWPRERWRDEPRERLRGLAGLAWWGLALMALASAALVWLALLTR